MIESGRNRVLVGNSSTRLLPAFESLLLRGPHAHTHTHHTHTVRTRLTAFFQDYLREPVPER